MNVTNKFEFLSFAGFSSLVYGLWVRLDPTRVEHLSLLRMILASTINIRLDWEGL
jgi:hypothetical protein